jgi:hypothetical protein
VRIILDECVNLRVRRLLEADHAVFTALELGWGGLPDHAVLEQLQGRCDAFLTVGRGFEHEHNLSSLRFGIVIVHVPRNRMAYYELVREKIIEAVSSVRPGEVLHVS